MKHIPKKRFGQHFLTDKGVLADIVDRVSPKLGDVLVEIGPGLGALTLPLLARCGKLTVIELDRDLAAHWRGRDGISVVESDVLKVDFAAIRAQVGANLRVVGNLPYNISTPILFHLLGCAALVEDQHFMLQKEVVERMVAKPATSAYGRLSVMLQWRYEMDNFLHVPPHAFEPPPRVDSAVVSMRPRLQPTAVDFKTLEDVVRVAFSQRRKLLRHSLGAWLTQRGFAGSFDVQRRAEEVPVDEFVALAALLSPK